MQLQVQVGTFGYLLLSKEETAPQNPTKVHTFPYFPDYDVKDWIAPRLSVYVPQGTVRWSAPENEALHHLLHDGNGALASTQRQRSPEIWHDASMRKH